MDKRIIVERKEGFQIEAHTFQSEFAIHFHKPFLSLRYFLIYDLFDIEENTYQRLIEDILIEPMKDVILDAIIEANHIIAIEYLPGQFDQRADALLQCIRLIDADANPTITTGHIISFDEDVSSDELRHIKKYLINPVDSREKNLDILTKASVQSPPKEEVVHGFIQLSFSQLMRFIHRHHLSMSIDDLYFVQHYFKYEEKRDPYLAEIKVLDTYWSDHCRHTTFETELESIAFDIDPISHHIQATFDDFLATRSTLHRQNKPLTLMEMATINRRYEEATGHLTDLEKSEEMNAASIEIDVDGEDEKWLLMFKNETHNHPTEIEPFGGASTCIGGAIRDPLSGRSFVYGAMRITGAGNICAPIEDALPHKLPQSVISKQAALGYSSYGNQIGLATPYVKELFHPGYVAKRMEVGAVIGAVKKSHVVRGKPQLGDIVLLIGGRTGRDGIGGATGSSQLHNTQSLETSSSEVQKGNAPEERKMQRLFRNPFVTKKIKKANDFGAGGVSVAVGELSDGIRIHLDSIRTKYEGISGLELAISESQERMAIVIDPIDVNDIIQACEQENLEAYPIALITDTNRIQMVYHDETIVDMSRDFLNTAGVRQKAQVKVKSNPMHPSKQKYDSIKDRIISMLESDMGSSLQGLDEQFDATIHRLTVLAPYGGQYKLTKSQGVVQKIPVDGLETKTVSLMSYGFDPYISEVHPFHGAYYAVLESMAKIVAMGGTHQLIRFSFQEYFEKMTTDPLTWGKPFSALLGAYEVLKSFSLAAIGGKDSMSGTYQELHVPPTLISFAFATGNIDQIIAGELKAPNHYLYLYQTPKNDIDLLDLSQIQAMFFEIENLIKDKTIISAYALEATGTMGALIQMSIGNKIGFEVASDLDLFQKAYGSMVVETTKPLMSPFTHHLGMTIDEPVLYINGEIISIDEVIKHHQKRYQTIYPIIHPQECKPLPSFKVIPKTITPLHQYDDIRVFVPIFPGTNCEYDTIHAFQKEGALVDSYVINTMDHKRLEQSMIMMSQKIKQSHILVLSGGFSSGDEPDGSGKFIATCLKHPLIKEAINEMLAKKHLILGICNGFQALIKSGLLPYGTIRTQHQNDATLTKNDINRHVAKFITTKVVSNASPWLSSFQVGEQHTIALSHGEGKFVINPTQAEALFLHQQVAFQYADDHNEASMNPLYNPNGSDYAIEGITSPDGLILGKMGHSERGSNELYKNIYGNKEQNIFKNAIEYLRRKPIC